MVQRDVQGLEYIYQPEHRLGQGEDGGGGGVVRGDQPGGEVAVAQVFFQGEGDRAGQVVADVVGQGVVFIHSF